MKLQSLLHFRTDVKDNIPTTNDIELGEIAINHATDGETLFIKNNDDKIAEFKDTKYYSKITDDIYSKLDTIDKTIEDNEFVVATTLTYLDEKVTDVIQTIEENELVTATALTDLDNRLLEVENGGVGNEGTITGVSVNGTSIATSGVANIPAASTSAYGVTKLTTATTSTSTTLAATASAVKAAYDLANSYKGTVTEVKANGTSIATSGVANIPAASTSAYGVTKLTSATNSTSTTLAATASAVKAAYDLANSYKGTVTEVKINGTNKTPTSGVVDLGTVITAHQDISHLATKEEVEDLTNEVIDNEFVVATTLTYLDEKVTDVIQTIEENELVTATALTDLDNRLLEVENGGGSSSEDIRYFTEFTVEGLIEASNTNETIDGQSQSELNNAAVNNKLICIPYRDADKGYEVASYTYKYDYTTLRLEYNGNVYITSPGDNDTIMGECPINLSGGIVEIVNNSITFQITVQDNTTYNVSVEGELESLDLGVWEPLPKGSTIRFFSSHDTENNPMTITFGGAEVLWPNGEMPEIEIDTWYELSLTSASDGHVLAVLVPFKAVE